MLDTENIDIVFKKLSTESDCITGINDSGIETYKNKPIVSLLKEELQNSTDAHDFKNAADAPVIVTVDLFEMNIDEIPDHSEYCDMFYDELEYWSGLQKNDTKPKEFFEQAIKVLNDRTIPILHISDRNTTGLLGVDEVGTPWDNIVKNDGVSDKVRSAGGSFGIGKNAAFACSDLRTVFYNTYTVEGEKGFQGCVKLPSYKKNGINYDGKSFFCRNDETPACKAVREDVVWHLSDSQYRMPGMDKYILGFNGPKDKEKLKRELIPAAVSSFLYAIYTGSLVVIIEGTEVSAKTLENIFAEYDDVLDRTTKQYYAVLREPDKTEYLSLFEKDDVMLSVKLAPGYSKKAAIIRKSGMYVFDKKHITGDINFAGIVYLKNDLVNEYFRKIEDSEHSKWAYDRAGNPKEAKEYSARIRNKLREMVNSLRQDHYGAEIDAEGVSEYLPGVFINDGSKPHENLSNEVEKITQEIYQPFDSRKEVFVYTSAGTSGNSDEGSQSRQKQQGGNSGSRKTKRKRKKSSANQYFDKHPDAFELSNEESEYSIRYAKGRMKFTNNTSDLKNVCLEIFIACATESKKDKIGATIRSAQINGTPARYEKNRIYLGNMRENESVLINFTTEWEGDLSLEVTAYAE